MATTFKSLWDGEAPTSITTEYTVPGATTTRLTEIWAANNSGATRTLSINIVPSGGASGNGNLLIPAMDVPIGTPLIIALNSYLDTGDFIRVLASGANVAVKISGMERA